MLEHIVLNPAADSLKKSLIELQQIRNSEKEAESWDDFLAELEADHD